MHTHVHTTMHCWIYGTYVNTYLLHAYTQVTGYGEKIRWYNYKNMPDSIYLVLRRLTQVVESLVFKVTMSKCIVLQSLHYLNNCVQND